MLSVCLPACLIPGELSSALPWIILNFCWLLYFSIPERHSECTSPTPANFNSMESGSHKADYETSITVTVMQCDMFIIPLQGIILAERIYTMGKPQ